MNKFRCKIIACQQSDVVALSIEIKSKEFYGLVAACAKKPPVEKKQDQMKIKEAMLSFAAKLGNRDDIYRRIHQRMQAFSVDPNYCISEAEGSAEKQQKMLEITAKILPELAANIDFLEFSDKLAGVDLQTLLKALVLVVEWTPDKVVALINVALNKIDELNGNTSYYMLKIADVAMLNWTALKIGVLNVAPDLINKLQKANNELEISTGHKDIINEMINRLQDASYKSS
ncbi:hypothetical protein ACFL5G_01930 [Candidatus Margulisiibacteriota bacterium]